MKRVINTIGKSTNGEWSFLNFTPYRDENDVIHIVKAEILPTSYIEKLDIKVGDEVAA